MTWIFCGSTYSNYMKKEQICATESFKDFLAPSYGERVYLWIYQANANLPPNTRNHKVTQVDSVTVSYVD